MKNRVNTIVRSEMSRREFLKAIGVAAGATLILPSCVIQQPMPAPAAATPAPVSLSAGMVDTSAYKKDSPWAIGRSGMGEVNSWQVMATLHFEYGVKEGTSEPFFCIFFVVAFCLKV